MTHSCAASRIKHLATLKRPFHFADSGLSDVYLVGITFYTCKCGRTTADIPAITDLMEFVARDLLVKKASLAGEEIRFLRKRLGKKQVDFAHEIGIEPETLNRYENGKLALSEPSDKLIRLYYLTFSSDPKLERVRKVLLGQLAGWSTTEQPKKIVAKKTANDAWEEVVAG
jgi:DNA-binding transcriptional regulator YiaG